MISTKSTHVQVRMHDKTYVYDIPSASAQFLIACFPASQIMKKQDSFFMVSRGWCQDVRVKSFLSRLM